MTNQYEPPEPEGEHEAYGFMERELIFKLLASHALVDAEFFEQLRRNPAESAEQLHIALNEDDLDYLRNKVEWDVIAAEADKIRKALHLEDVTNSW